MNKSEVTNKKYKKFTVGIAVIIVLITAFVLITLAWNSIAASVSGNAFTTGSVDVEIGIIDGGNIVYDGSRPLIDYTKYESGATLQGDFVVKNSGDADAYIKLYLEDEAGTDIELAEGIEVKLYDMSNPDNPDLIKQNKAADMNEAGAEYLDSVLKAGEEAAFRITFHLSEDAGNTIQNRNYNFAIKCDAIQVRNRTQK